jgi:hypothetical protein
MKKYFLIFTGVFLLITLSLLLTDTRVLVFEEKIAPGNSLEISGFVYSGTPYQGQLVCRYFSGRSILTTVYWLSPNNVMGKDQCPFINRVQ